jgi:hypothetical protein
MSDWSKVNDMGAFDSSRTSDPDQMLEALASSARIRQPRKGGSMSVFLMILFAVFVAIELLAVGMATTSYRSLHELQEKSEHSTLELGPVVSAIRAGDARSSIARGSGPEGDALVVVENLDSGTYENRIYLYQGSLVEEYAVAGTPYTPSKATRLGPTTSFSITYDDGLLTITTDDSCAKVALRNALGGA